MKLVQGVLILAAFGLACSCGTSLSSYFPMKKNGEWSYAVQGDFDTFVDKVRVARQVPVGHGEGYELVGGMGVSRLAWDGTTLLASELSGQRFDPPVPLLATQPMKWKGIWETAGKPQPASAELTYQATKETIAGRKYASLRSTVTFLVKGRTTILDTWFVQGIGILRQEQRTDERLERRLDYLSGP